MTYIRRGREVTYIESPTWLSRFSLQNKVLFLAGGITGCPDWQQEMRRKLEDTDWILLNPRQKHFPIHDPSAASAQITWEYMHLRRATAILFWFPCETICPIVLYELGSWIHNLDKPLFIGVHPDYSRRQDVEIQTSLARPDLSIVYSLEELAEVVRSA